MTQGYGTALAQGRRWFGHSMFGPRRRLVSRDSCQWPTPAKHRRFCAHGSFGPRVGQPWDAHQTGTAARPARLAIAAEWQPYAPKHLRMTILEGDKARRAGRFGFGRRCPRSLLRTIA